ncbi:hypothetical protein GQ602_000895 [Ophiocordyceps camponoti-floridani]|uniref:Uncharacterized protein n=1 Tax=Ophiocordyceps camponoti-floridani TaxID=2030778 RepID=A0A8H4QD57_9HYPO|nr:hypothetical protein GQ602_000895 [Ophiocordyceps camponoti-floridani]
MLAERLLNMREMELVKERQSSMPSHQFQFQVEEEARLRKTGGSQYPVWGNNLIGPGEPGFQSPMETVKQRWIEQGIWRTGWDVSGLPGDHWEHEQLDSECLPDTGFDAEAEGENGELVSNDEERRRAAQRRAERHDQQKQSRPLQQFAHQLSEERQRLQRRPQGVALEVDAVAYNKVKAAWTRSGIWDQTWALLPGNSWKHERTLDDVLANDAAYVEACRLVDRYRSEANDSPAERTGRFSRLD